MDTLSPSVARAALSAGDAGAPAAVPLRPPIRPPDEAHPARIANSRTVPLAIDHRQYAFVRRAAQRQTHLEMCAAFVRGANQLHRAAMGLHAFGHDREAD